METLRAAYAMAKQNDGAPGVDGVTIEAQGAEALLEQLRDELTGHTYQPLPARRQEIPKDGGKVRVLSIPAIRDRVVQGALKLILEPVFEADFQPGSYGYRPKRTVVVGSPEEVAEELIAWVEDTDVDGFNLAYAVVPETFTGFVDLIVPEPQKRGRYKRDYAPGTLREKLHGQGRA